MTIDIDTIFADRRKIAATARQRIKAVARSCLFIEQLKATGSDADDYHERHVSLIQEALSRAWYDGFNEALRKSRHQEIRP